MDEFLIANKTDTRELYDLQLVAFESEAKMIGSRDVPALMETYDDFCKDFSNWTVLTKKSDSGKIIAAVRFKRDENHIEIGRLMTAPEYRNQGIAADLMYEVEKVTGESIFELFTCTKSYSNIRLYEKLGYQIYKTERGAKDLTFAYMRKVNNAAVIEKAKEYLAEIFRGNADGHDAEHSLRVYHNASQIVAKHPDCDSLVVSLAALLHDVDDHKLFSTQNNENARHFLKKQSIADDKIDKICEVINSVSFSKNKGKTPQSLEAKIVQDADRLDAIGAIGIARTFAYGGKSGRSIKDSIQHFYEKLLLLKDMMNTKEARAMADERHSFMETFLKEFNKEIKHPLDRLSNVNYNKVIV